MSASKAKGTKFEREVCEYLSQRLKCRVERRALASTNDCGDVAGVEGWVLEAKCCRQLDLAAFVEEARKEALNDGAPFFAVVAKRRMKGVAQSYVVMPLETWCDWYLETR